jgi:hypothetical protein
VSAAESRIGSLVGAPPDQIVRQADDQALEGLKFPECLPKELATRVVQSRVSDVRGVADVIGRPLRIVYQD